MGQLGLRRLSSTIFSGMPITQSSGNPQDFLKIKEGDVLTSSCNNLATSPSSVCIYEIKAVVLPSNCSALLKGLSIFLWSLQSCYGEDKVVPTVKTVRRDPGVIYNDVRALTLNTL